MYKAIAAAAALAVAFTPAPSFAQDGVRDADDAEMERVICKRESVVGSRVQKRRTCMTRREWIALQVKTRDGVADFMRRNTGGVDPTK
jgi:hypothetical protein